MNNETNFFSSSEQITVRPYTLEDLPLLNRLRALLYQYHKSLASFKYTDMDPFDMLDADSYRVTSKYDMFFIACLDSKPIGFASCDIEINKSMGEISELFVDPDFRRRGAATALFEACQNWLIEHNCEYLEVSVYAGNEAQNFYSARGMKISYIDCAACVGSITKIPGMKIAKTITSEEAAQWGRDNAERVRGYEDDHYFCVDTALLVILDAKSHFSDGGSRCVIYGDRDEVVSLTNALTDCKFSPETKFLKVTVPKFNKQLEAQGFTPFEYHMIKALPSHTSPKVKAIMTLDTSNVDELRRILDHHIDYLIDMDDNRDIIENVSGVLSYEVSAEHDNISNKLKVLASVLADCLHTRRDRKAETKEERELFLMLQDVHFKMFEMKLL